MGKIQRKWFVGLILLFLILLKIILKLSFIVLSWLIVIMISLLAFLLFTRTVGQ